MNLYALVGWLAVTALWHSRCTSATPAPISRGKKALMLPNNPTAEECMEETIDFECRMMGCAWDDYNGVCALRCPKFSDAATCPNRCQWVAGLCNYAPADPSDEECATRKTPVHCEEFGCGWLNGKCGRDCGRSAYEGSCLLRGCSWVEYKDRFRCQRVPDSKCAAVKDKRRACSQLDGCIWTGEKCRKEEKAGEDSEKGGNLKSREEEFKTCRAALTARKCEEAGEGCTWDKKRKNCAGGKKGANCARLRKKPCKHTKGCYWTNADKCHREDDEGAPVVACTSHPSKSSCEHQRGCRWSRRTGCSGRHMGCRKNMKKSVCVTTESCGWVGTAAEGKCVDVGQLPDEPTKDSEDLDCEERTNRKKCLSHPMCDWLNKKLLCVDA